MIENKLSKNHIVKPKFQFHLCPIQEKEDVYRFLFTGKESERRVRKAPEKETNKKSLANVPAN